MPGLNTYHPRKGRVGIVGVAGVAAGCSSARSLVFTCCWQWQFNGSAIADPSLSNGSSGWWTDSSRYISLRDSTVVDFFVSAIESSERCRCSGRNMSMIYCSLCGQELKSSFCPTTMLRCWCRCRSKWQFVMFVSFFS